MPTDVRLRTLHKVVLYCCLAALWISGVLWLVAHYFFSVKGTFGASPHWSEQWWLSAHGAAAMAMLVALGSLVPNHMRNAWTLRHNRISGAALTALWLWLAATGYALYYFLTDANAQWLPAVHWVVGLLVAFLVPLHLWAGRRRGSNSRR